MTFNYRERDIRQTATAVSVDAAGAPNASRQSQCQSTLSHVQACPPPRNTLTATETPAEGDKACNGNGFFSLKVL